MTDRAATATYLFGVTTDDVSLPADSVPPMPGAGPVRALGAGGVRAVVCDVDREVYGRLETPGDGGLDVLAAAARSHDAVLAAIADVAPVLPLRLGTSFPGDAAVCELLERHRHVLRTELERVRGHAEWNVRVHLPEPAVDDEPERASTSGVDYLRARQAALSAREERWRTRDAVARHIHGVLGDVAVDAARIGRRPLDDRVSPALHAVYLVADRDRDRFTAAVDRLRDEHGVRIEVTGPWPPYHFTALVFDDRAESRPA